MGYGHLSGGSTSSPSSSGPLTGSGPLTSHGALTGTGPLTSGGSRRAPAPSKKKGGGFLSGVEHVGHWVEQKSGLAAHDLKAQTEVALWKMPQLAAENVWESARHPIAHGERAKMLHQQWSDLFHGHVLRSLEEPSKPKWKDVATPADRGTAALTGGMVRGTIATGEHPLRDPFVTAETLLPFLHGVGKVADVASGGRVVGERAAPRMLRQGDVSTPLHGSTNPSVRVVQNLYDKTLQHALDKHPEGRVAGHGVKRIEGSIAETERYRARMREVPANLLDTAARKLTRGRRPGERRVRQAALELTSVNTSPEEAVAYHLKQAADGVNPELNRQVAALYQKVADRGMLTSDERGHVVVAAHSHPALARADTELAHVQVAGDEILHEHGLMTEEGTAARNNAPARVRAGGTFEKPTPAKLGVPSDRLAQQRNEVARLEKAHDRALTKTLEAAQARATKMEPSPGKEPTVSALGTRILAPGKVIGAKGATRVEKLGGALSVARDKLEQMEARAARNVKPTGIVGPTAIPFHERRIAEFTDQLANSRPDTIKAGRLMSLIAGHKAEIARLEQIGQAREGRGFVGYKVDRPGTRRIGIRSRAKPPVVGSPKGPISGPEFTGKGIERGLVPENVTRDAASHYRLLVKFWNSFEFRDQLRKTGSPTRRTSHDVLVRDPNITVQSLAAKIAEDEGISYAKAKRMAVQRMKIPVELSTAIGKTERRVNTAEEAQALNQDAESVYSRYKGLREHFVPGLKDNFAKDRAEAIGAKAPDGFTWVDDRAMRTLTEDVFPRGRPGEIGDALNRYVTLATVYLKPGHLGTRYLTNLATSVIQGSWSYAKSNHDLWTKLDGRDRARLLAASGQHGMRALPHEGTGRSAVWATRGADWWARHADQGFRWNNFLYEARKAGFSSPEEIRHLLDKLGDHGEGMNAAQWAKMDWVAKRANRASIAYDRMNPAERRYFSRYVWFYPWIKGSTLFTGHVAIEHPYKAAVMGQSGLQGRKDQKETLGNLPSYAQGDFKIGGSAGNPLVTDFSTFSPFSSAGDLLDLTGPGKLGALANPAWGALLQLVTRQNQFGQHTNKPLSDAFSTLLSPTPEAQMFDAWRHPTHGMYDRTLRTTGLRALLGPSTPRRLHPAKAHKAYGREVKGN